MDQPSDTPVPPPPAEPPPRAPSTLPSAPVSAAEMRASDADRDRIAQVLRTAFEEGRLTIEEHSERIEALYGAKTMGELEPLTYDLPTGPAPGLARPNLSKSPTSAPSPYRPAHVGSVSAESPSFVAVFGSAERRGPGRIGPRLRAAAIFGGVEIDLSEATFETPVLVINVATVFGGIDIRVPEGVTVRGHGAGIFGGFSVHQQVAEDPNAPVVVVRGAAVFGGVDVRPKKPRRWKRDDD